MACPIFYCFTYCNLKFSSSTSQLSKNIYNLLAVCYYCQEQPTRLYIDTTKLIIRNQESRQEIKLVIIMAFMENFIYTVVINIY